METLREFRRQKGWSQKDLADKSGVGQDTISGIERGQHEPRPSTLRRLAEALDVEVADFFKEPALAWKTQAPVDEAEAGQNTARETADWLLEESEGEQRVWARTVSREAFDNVTRALKKQTAQIASGTFDPRTGRSYPVNRERERLLHKYAKLRVVLREELARAFGVEPTELRKVGASAIITKYAPQSDKRPLVRWIAPEAERAALREQLDDELGPGGYDEREFGEEDEEEVASVEILEPVGAEPGGTS